MCRASLDEGQYRNAVASGRLLWQMKSTLVSLAMDKNEKQPVLVEGDDYYLENGLMVLTARYLLRRGYCCEQGCRHCPYGYSDKLIHRAHDEEQS